MKRIFAILFVLGFVVSGFAQDPIPKINNKRTGALTIAERASVNSTIQRVNEGSAFEFQSELWDTVYIYGATGSDASGDGSAQKPYKTFYALSKINRDFGAYILVDTTTLYWDEVFTIIQKYRNAATFIQSIHRVIDTIEGCATTGNDFLMTTTTPMVDGAYNDGKFLKRVGYSVYYPIWQNHDDTLVVAFQAGYTTYEITEPQTKMLYRTNGWRTMDCPRVVLSGLEIVADYTIQNYIDEFTMQNCYIHSSQPIYAVFGQYNNPCIITACIFDNELSNDGGEIIRLSGATGSFIYRCVFKQSSSNTRFGDGLDIWWSYHVFMDDLIISRSRSAYKLENCAVNIGDAYVHQAECYFEFQEEGSIELALYSSATPDTYLDSVDMFIDENYPNDGNGINSNAGRVVDMEEMDIINVHVGAGYTFSNRYVNHTANLSENYYVSIGYDSVDFIIDGLLFYEPPHAALSFEDASTTLTMTQNNWVQITNATDDLFSDVDAQRITNTADSITIIVPGDYMINASLSFSGTTNADVYEFALFKNGVIASPKIERTTTSSDIGNVSLPFYVQGLVAGDDLTLRMRNTANDFDATLVACSWIIWQLHPE